MPLETLQQHLAAEGRWYPPTPTFTGAFVGGVIATNAAGAATFKHGTTRQWIDGLTVVLPCGHVLDVNRGEVRADAGARLRNRLSLRHTPVQAAVLSHAITSRSAPLVTSRRRTWI